MNICILKIQCINNVFIKFNKHFNIYYIVFNNLTYNINNT